VHTFKTLELPCREKKLIQLDHSNSTVAVKLSRSAKILVLYDRSILSPQKEINFSQQWAATILESAGRVCIHHHLDELHLLRKRNIIAASIVDDLSSC
jgi:hypothetical protein